MIRKYSLLVAGDASGYSAHVPEIPTILITGESPDELTARAKEAIRIYWESVPYGKRTGQVERPISS